MAGDSNAVLKRQREAAEEEQQTLTLTLEAAEEEELQQPNLSTKRQKSSSSLSSSSSSSSYDYDHMLSFLDEEEEKLTQQDLSSLITTLQQELSPSSATSEFEYDVAPAANGEEIDDRERVFRHLLEASDDELGLPSREEGTSSSGVSEEPSQFSVNGSNDTGDLSLTNLSSMDGLWELEDEAANYYALLQSELFVERDGQVDA